MDESTNLNTILGGHVVRATDVGFGNVKLTLKHTDSFGPIECLLFPSRSPAAGNKSLTAGIVKARDTVVVRVNGNDYEVGRGVTMAQGTFDEVSILDNDFCLSDGYLARFRGALYYMMGNDKDGKKYFAGDKISMMVVGLPVSAYQNESLRAKLRTKLTGEHELPDGRTVTVGRILVLPQPLGAFFEYAMENGMLDSMSQQNNLIIDPGFNTFDWVMCTGLTPMDQRSGSVNRGMSAVIKAIVESAKKRENWNADTGMLIRLMDDHFREGKPFNVYGTDYDVDDYIGAGRPVINEAVAALTNSVGDGADIQNIILAGGGANLYVDAISAKFPRHKIIMTNNPVFSNVRGFQLAGEHQVILQLRSKRLVQAA